MAILDWPTGRSWRPARMTFGASTPKSAWAGFFTGQSQSISHLGDRLRVEMTLPPCLAADAGPREAYLMSLASTGDWVRLWHMQRPTPGGTLRGDPTVRTSAAAGARSVQITGGNTPKNLLASTLSFDDAQWTAAGTGSVTANSSTGPNSSIINADLVTDSSSGGYYSLAQSFPVPDDSATYTASIYVKDTTGGTAPSFSLEIALSGGTGVAALARVNTDTGAVLLGGGTVTVSSEDGGTWWRVSVPITNNASGNTVCTLSLFPARSPNGSGTASATVTGSATLWGAQVELGAVPTAFDGTVSLLGGDIIGIGSQLCPVAYAGANAFSLPYLTVPLALPLRQAVTAGAPVSWFQPTGNFQLLGDLSQVEYLPGRYQGAVPLQFVEVY